MRRILVSNMVSVDALFSGPRGELDWHNVDNEFNKFAIEQLNSVDTIIFGRITYTFMANYWPTDEAKKDDPKIAAKMNSINKIVVSRTLASPVWENTTHIFPSIKELKEEKEKPGKDMIIFGSSNLISSLTNEGLIDEYRLIINPIILGNGVPLFKNILHKIPLTLIKSQQMLSGNIILFYEKK